MKTSSTRSSSRGFDQGRCGLGLTAIQELSHATENVYIRSKKLIPTPEIINVLLIASDSCKA